jgi:DNA-binding NarL/FixJ family response regulator
MPTSVWAIQVEGSMGTLQKNCPHVGFLSMLTLQSEAIFAECNLHQHVSDIALIFLTEVADEGIVEKCLQVGATDCLAEDGRLARDSRNFNVWGVKRTEQ